MIAIIGPTASGKSDLALQLAQKYNYEILSLDSLSIYKQIDIASAKPSKEELSLVKHYGINEIYPNEKFDVTDFFEIFNKCKKENLIIVGGSSFYLKAMLTGISKFPKFNEDIIQEAQKIASYEKLLQIDPEYAKKITKNDTYRIQKLIALYLQTNLTPTQYFNQNPPKPIIQNIPIYEIAVDRNILRERIKLRTEKMLKMGLIDEISFLEKRYKRNLTPMKAIGIKEVLDYFDGKYNKDTLKEKIITNTARLAKRQQIFNKTQIPNKISLPLEELKKIQLK